MKNGETDTWIKGIVNKVVFQGISLLCGALVILGKISLTRVQSDIEKVDLKIDVVESRIIAEQKRLTEYISKIEQVEIRPVREEQIKRAGRITDLEIQVRVLQAKFAERDKVPPNVRGEEWPQ